VVCGPVVTISKCPGFPAWKWECRAKLNFSICLRKGQNKSTIVTWLPDQYILSFNLWSNSGFNSHVILKFPYLGNCVVCLFVCLFVLVELGIEIGPCAWQTSALSLSYNLSPIVLLEWIYYSLVTQCELVLVWFPFSW
jgi:hypothetical protein